LVFDLDGTLIDSVQDLSLAVNYALRLHSLPQRSLVEVRSAIGNGATRLISQLIGKEQAAKCEKVLRDFLEYYYIHCTDNTITYEDCSETLRILNKHFQMSILTNKPFAPSFKILQHLRIDILFSEILGGDSIVHKKPNPEGLHFISQKYSCFVFPSCLLIRR